MKTLLARVARALASGQGQLEEETEIVTTQPAPGVTTPTETAAQPPKFAQHNFGPGKCGNGPCPGPTTRPADNGDGVSEQRAPATEIPDAEWDANRRSNVTWTAAAVAAARLRRQFPHLEKALTDENFMDLDSSTRQKYLEVHPYSEFWDKTGGKEKQYKLQKKREKEGLKAPGSRPKENKPTKMNQPANPRHNMNRPNQINHPTKPTKTSRTFGK